MSTERLAGAAEAGAASAAAKGCHRVVVIAIDTSDNAKDAFECTYMLRPLYCYVLPRACAV